MDEVAKTAAEHAGAVEEVATLSLGQQDATAGIASSSGVLAALAVELRGVLGRFRTGADPGGPESRA
jgi:hypothetical protein